MKTPRRRAMAAVAAHGCGLSPQGWTKLRQGHQELEMEAEDPSEDGSEELSFEPCIEVPASILRPPPPVELRPADKICRSPIAGVVVSVSIAAGQKVRQDDPAVAIEAMKMVTTIGVPAEGAVATVDVVPGQAVKTGQPLYTLA